MAKDCGCAAAAKELVAESKKKWVWKCPKGVKQIGMSAEALRANQCRKILRGHEEKK